MAQKAAELCGEVRSLGQALLSALEKRDAEHLALVRARHETGLLALVEQVRKLQGEEAEQSRKALLASRESAATRYLHYQELLGVQSPQVPAIGEPVPEHAASQHVVIEEEGDTKVIPLESEEMAKLEDASDEQGTASEWDIRASYAHAFPNINISPWGIGTTIGGSNVGSVFSAFAGRNRAEAAEATTSASRAAKLAQYALRAHDWLLQSNLAAREIMQVDQQILAAELRVQMAQKDLANHRRQMQNAREVEDLMRDKYTGEQLYGWMVGRVAAAHFQGYQLAYDLAKRAERAWQFELGAAGSSFIRFGYWDNLKKGLLAGEQLALDLKRMEAAYLEQNRREYEVTKHLSLALLDPLALLQLRENGSCTLSVPESAFDLDFPGHYFRRIKSASVSLPCVTGPYAGVPCTLRLLRSSVRRQDRLTAGKYARQPEDPRFTDHYGAIESIVTSAGQNDSGLFELNLRDERYLPFEGAGAISTWQLELPAAFRQFDYATISDTVLQLRYTAREGGAPLRAAAEVGLAGAMNDAVLRAGQSGLHAAFNLRHEFGNEWRALKRDGSVKLSIPGSRLAYFAQGRVAGVAETRWYARLSTRPAEYALHAGGAVALRAVPALSRSYEGISPAPLALATEFTLAVADAAALADLVLVLKLTLR